MAKTKKMKEAAFEKLVKELDAVGEMIRVHQDEKQAVLNDYDKQRRKFKTGKISKKSLVSSVKKTNKELKKQDKEIKKVIKRTDSLTKQITKFADRQKPKVIRAKMSGLKKSKSKKKVKKRKAVRKKRR